MAVTLCCRRRSRLRRGDRDVRPRHGARGPRRCTPPRRCSAAARRPSAPSRTPSVPGLPRPARRPAGRQREGRRGGDPDRSGAELRDRRVVPLRPEELLLPGHAEELPDLAVRRADRLQRVARRRGRRRCRWHRGVPGRDRARPWRRTRASPSMSAARPGASTAPTTRSSTTTARGSRIEIVTKPIVGAGAAGAGGRRGPTSRPCVT